MTQEINEKSPAWQRKEGKNPSGGLNAKGVASYRKENPGSKLKTAVTTDPSKLKKGSKAANRRKSFCARMKGMKKSRTSAETARDPDSRINKSLRKWNCSTELPQLGSLSEKKVNPWAVCHASTGPEKTDKFERCVKKVKGKTKMSVKENIQTKFLLGILKFLAEGETLGPGKGKNRSNKAAGHVERMKGHTKRIRKNPESEVGPRGSGERGKVFEPEPKKPKGLGKGGKHTTRADALGHGAGGKFVKGTNTPAPNPKSRTGKSGHEKAMDAASKKEAPLSKKQIDSMGSASKAAKDKAAAERMETVKKVFAARKAKKNAMEEAAHSVKAYTKTNAPVKPSSSQGKKTKPSEAPKAPKEPKMTPLGGSLVKSWEDARKNGWRTS